MQGSTCGVLRAADASTNTRPGTSEDLTGPRQVENMTCSVNSRLLQEHRTPNWSHQVPDEARTMITVKNTTKPFCYALLCAAFLSLAGCAQAAPEAKGKITKVAF